MSGHFPKIQNPCPRRLRAMPRLGVDQCSLCDKRVHRLDLISQAHRRQLINESAEPICVAYLTPSKSPPSGRRSAALGLAAALSAGAGHAAPSIGEFDPAATHPMALQLSPHVESAADCDDPDQAESMLLTVMIGGISHADEADWLSAQELAALPLPMISEEALLEDAIIFTASGADE